jgi:hypothetical protein
MTSHTPKKPAKLHCVSRIVSGPFFVEDRIYDDVFRGPFFSSKDWLTTRLTLAENECRRQIERISKASEKRKDMLRMVHSHDSDLASESEDSEEDDAEEIYRTLRIIERLMARLDDFFPPNDIGVATEPEHSMLFHYDLSSHNILVDDDGNLTGVVDWECVSILPLWAACRVPAFLEGRIVDKEPSKAHFGLAEDEELEGNDDAALYLENLRYYHVTLLRRLFLDKMREIEPNWVQVYEASERQRDFDFAVSSCDDGLIMRRIENWLDDMDAGSKNVKGLQQRMEDGTL